MVNDTAVATRRMFRAIMRQLLALLAALLVLGVAVGWLVAGTPGVWGALMAVAIAAFFLLPTVVVMLLTVDKPVAVTSAALVVAWFVKMLVLLGALAAVRGADLHHRGTFFVTLALAIVASSAIEMRAAAVARVPNTERVGDAAG